MEIFSFRTVFLPVGKRAGISLLQVLVAIAIIGILAAILIPSFQGLLRKAGRVKCTNNLRQLHLVFSNYLQDVDHWPQIPVKLTESESDYQKWWIGTMEPYGAPPNLWLCPVMEKARIKDASGDLILMHYIPTQFDMNRISPTRWPRQPWLIERGDAHGGGSLILFPDGSVKGLGQILQDQ